MQTAFVAGATGYTGREVVRQLCAAGVRTIAHVRPAMGAVVHSTAWTPDSMRATVRRCQPDVAFGLLGTTRARTKAAAEAGAANAGYLAVDYGMTHMLLDALRSEATTATMVYLSAMGVSADSRYEYARVRGMIEAELMTSGLTYVIARPLFISGSDREVTRPAERIATILTDGVLTGVGLIAGRAFTDRFRSITAQRLAKALISAANDPAAANSIQHSRDLQRRADQM